MVLQGKINAAKAKISHQYDDIIGLPHHQSQVRPRMSRTSRAAQFAPFAALTGYEAAILETARLTDVRIELDESIVDPTDVEMLEDLIMAAINDGYAKADKVYEEKMGAYGNMGSLGGML